MPKYNGSVSFVVEVLAHLLWCYIIFALAFLIFAGAFFALLGAGFGGFVLVAGLATGDPPFSIGSLHFVTMGWFTVYFAPRFPYASQLLTFALATLFGAMTVTTAWALDRFGMPSSEAAGVWVASHSDDLAVTPAIVIAASVIAGLIGKLVHVGGVGAYLWGPGRWIGWVIVGRAAYEAFAEREAARLRREYDEYVGSLHK